MPSVERAALLVFPLPWPCGPSGTPSMPATMTTTLKHPLPTPLKVRMAAAVTATLTNRLRVLPMRSRVRSLLTAAKAAGQAILLPDAAVAAPVLSLKLAEKEQVRRALERAGGNRRKAAELLGVSRATLYRKLKDHRLS